MDGLADQQLLRDYAEKKSEAAFAELARRYVDLVYSAALRMVNDTHAAKDVTQEVFVALAQSSRLLSSHPVLAGWLHQTTRNLAANSIRANTRRSAREQEAATMNEILDSQGEAGWDQIAPQLDDALHELSKDDRDALLLRYFQRKSAQEMAEVLGISSEAAQKRVNRAVERLREHFAKRGIAVGAGGLAVVLSANAVHAAPAGLVATVSAAVGTTIAISTTTKIIAMTTLQKTFVAAVLAAAIGTAVYEAHRSSVWRSCFDAQKQELAGRAQKLAAEREAAQKQLAELQSENGRLNRNDAELLRLRREMTQLRKPYVEQAAALPQPPDEQPPPTNAPSRQTFSATNNLTVGWGQTAITGGWQTPSGLRAYIFATPEQGTNASTLTVRLKVAEVSIPFESNASSNLISGVLSPDEYSAMLHAAQNGAMNIRDMKVTVFNGQQAGIRSGSSDDDYSEIALTPVISSDGQQVQMQIIPTLTYPTAER